MLLQRSFAKPQRRWDMSAVSEVGSFLAAVRRRGGCLLGSPSEAKGIVTLAAQTDGCWRLSTAMWGGFGGDGLHHSFAAMNQKSSVTKTSNVSHKCRRQTCPSLLCTAAFGSCLRASKLWIVRLTPVEPNEVLVFCLSAIRRDDAKRIGQRSIAAHALNEPGFRVGAASLAVCASDHDAIFGIIPGSHVAGCSGVVGMTLICVLSNSRTHINDMFKPLVALLRSGPRWMLLSDSRMRVVHRRRV